MKMVGSQNSSGNGIDSHVPRRHFLRSASALVGGLVAGSYGTLAAAPAAKIPKSVILIFNCGAPSHIDLFDPKPRASSEIRGEFGPIETNVPGIQVTELLPEVALRMDKLAVIRSVHHSHSSHNSGMHWSTVGRPYRMDSTLINPSPSDLPCFGTLVGWLGQKEGYSGQVPPYVITPYPHCDSTVYLTPGQFGGCLGARYDPFVVNADPNAPDFRVQNLRLQDEISASRFSSRLGLLREVASQCREISGSTATGMDVFHSQAAALVHSGVAARAFDLTGESDKTRDRYGRHQWGQSHLLARRLVESGARFVTAVNGRSIVWDTHQNNFVRMKQTLVPPMQQGFVALLDDLEERGMLETTLVIWMGDFGRTPKINSQAGRDHWPQCYTVVMAGCGVRGGQVIGESDATGAFPRLRPISPADIHASAFAALGYDSKNLYYQTADGRPVAVSDGNVIRELF